MRKVYNFSAGPAMLPEAVLQQAQAEMLDWQNSGMSVMEISHRSATFTNLIEQAEADLRELLNIPYFYKVLFLAGGASNQFAMVPLNLFSEENKTADYIDTGIWSKKAIEEAKRYGQVNLAASISREKPQQIPPQTDWDLNPNAAYVHYTPNETIDGIEFHWVPKTGDVPLVADMSSTILSRPIDISAYGIIYAGTQKNIGASGLTLVIIREDLIKQALPNTPTLYQYIVHDQNKSLYNTPPTFIWYLSALVFSWLKQEGGLQIMAEKNRLKANKLYEFIDNSGFYRNDVHPSCRSWMNVPFSIENQDLNDTFLQEAENYGLTYLSGHRLVGGMRASIYNAMPLEGVESLIQFMQHFSNLYG